MRFFFFFLLIIISEFSDFSLAGGATEIRIYRVQDLRLQTDWQIVVVAIPVTAAGSR